MDCRVERSIFNFLGKSARNRSGKSIYLCSSSNLNGSVNAEINPRNWISLVAAFLWLARRRKNSAAQRKSWFMATISTNGFFKPQFIFRHFGLVKNFHTFPITSRGHDNPSKVHRMRWHVDKQLNELEHQERVRTSRIFTSIEAPVLSSALHPRRFSFATV